MRLLGWEIYSASMDTQMRNAIYGVPRGIRESVTGRLHAHVVMPGMARLLRRPAYDFTRSYDYNRTRLAFGCYHCHMVK